MLSDNKLKLLIKQMMSLSQHPLY